MTMQYVIGLDIGSSKICAALMSLSGDGEVALCAMETGASAGLERGRVSDRLELSRAIDRVLTRVRHGVSADTSRVLTVLPPGGMTFQHNVGVVVSQSDTGQITLAEKQDCIRRSKNVVKLSDLTLLHALPLHYKIDGRVLYEPVGAFGTHLEVCSQLVLGASDTILALSQIFKDLQLHMSGVMYSGLALGQSALSLKQRHDGVVLMDVGGRFTTVSIFYRGVMQWALQVPIGGETITQDITQCLSVSMPEAERLKIGCVDLMFSESSDESVPVLDASGERQLISKALLCRVVRSRVLELLQLLSRDLPDGSLPYDVVLMGGSQVLTGLASFIAQYFDVSVSVSMPVSLEGVVHRPDELCAVGTVLYGIETDAVSFESEKPSLFKRLFGGIGRSR